MLSVRPTAIPDVRIIATRWFEDGRGSFSETFNRAAWREAGIDIEFIQDNHVLSRQPGTLRGLHFQRPPAAQAKLVRVTRGSILDVAVDIRAGSPWYGRWVATELSAAGRLQLLIPQGFAHGYVTLEADTEVFYKVDARYAPEHETGIVWDDPALAIHWPLPPTGAILAERDRQLPLLAATPPYFRYGT